MVMSKTVLVTGLLVAVQARAESGQGGSPAGDKQYDCAYKFFGVDFAQVKVTLLASGKVEAAAVVTNQGRSHEETTTAETAAPGESLHLWLSKENPQNAVELITYAMPQANGDSVLINHNVPFGQEVWGQCSVITVASN
jgi:hypothetical protein